MSKSTYTVGGSGADPADDTPEDERAYMTDAQANRLRELGADMDTILNRALTAKEAQHMIDDLEARKT